MSLMLPKERKDYWNLPFSVFLLEHPVGARWIMNGMLYLGTINLAAIGMFAYYKNWIIPAWILAIIAILYFYTFRKQAVLFNQNKNLTLKDIYVKK